MTSQCNSAFSGASVKIRDNVIKIGEHRDEKRAENDFGEFS